MGLAGIIGVCAGFNYAIAGIIFKKHSAKVHPLIIVAVAVVARLLSFPNYNARPHLFSELAFLLVVYVMLSEKKIPLLFAVFAVFIVIELIFRQFKTALIYLAAAAGAFVCSLLNPLGIKVWAYALVQSDGKDVWAYNIEWAPKTFAIWEIAVLLLVIVAFAVDGRVKAFDKNAILPFHELHRALHAGALHRGGPESPFMAQPEYLPHQSRKDKVQQRVILHTLSVLRILLRIHISLFCHKVHPDQHHVYGQRHSGI